MPCSSNEGLASTIGPNSGRFRRGTGRKFGEGIQFFTTGVGGIAYAFYSSWKVAFVILAVLPLVSMAALGVLSINQTKGAREARAYSKAGSVAYSSVSAIKTVLSLNAIPEMIRQMSRVAGIQRLELVAKIAGGANMFAQVSPVTVKSIGEQNRNAVEKVLNSLNIPIVARHVGGTSGRNLFVQVSTGTTQIQIVGQPVIEI